MKSSIKNIAIVFLLITLASCGPLSKLWTRPIIDENTTVTEQVTVDTIWQVDTIEVPVTFIDSIIIREKSDPIVEVDSSAVDSLQLLLAVKDEKLRQLIHDLKNKQFKIDPLYAENAVAYAEAGVTANRLYLTLDPKPIDLIVEYVDSSATMIIDRSITTEYIVERLVKESTFDNPWFAIAMVFILLAIIAIRTALKRKN